MAYRYKLQEPVPKGTRRIARDQIEIVRTKLGAPRRSESAVHESRKSLKRVRALLRLVRPAIGDKSFSALNAEIRDISALLSPVRDRQVLLETLLNLEEASNSSHKAAFSALKRVIKDKQRAKKRADGGVTTVALTRLETVGKRLSKLSFSGTDSDCIEQGLRVSVGRARRQMRRAFEENTDEAFHEWRKAAQLHWRQMQLLGSAWPSMFASRAEAGRQLSQLLGDDHDLSVLMAFIDSLSPKSLRGAHAKTIRRLAGRRQKELRAVAKPHGLILFAEKPGSFAKRIRRTWEAAIQLNGKSRKSMEPRKTTKATRSVSRGNAKKTAKPKAAPRTKSTPVKRTRAPRPKASSLAPRKDRRH